ncbi:hypothetical protein BDW72DRAFT_198452 [Aspergillus terricola var. indicus]
MARPTTSKQISRLTLYAIITLVGLALIWWSHISFTSEAPTESEAAPVFPIPSADHVQSITIDIRNDTLGFEAIFAINFPRRVDKRDNIILDQNWNHAIHRPIKNAARRSHLNVMQRILKDRLASAIVMEDDGDWDVSLKTQLQSFALSVRALQLQNPIDADTNAYAATTEASPYGNNWDILWLGHCSIKCNFSAPYYLAPNDPTVPPPEHFLPYWRDPPPHERPPTARMTCPITDGVCSIVYAVSFRSAQKILAALSVNPSGLAEEIDISAEFNISLGHPLYISIYLSSFSWCMDRRRNVLGSLSCHRSSSPGSLCG